MLARLPPLADATAIHLLRFAVMLVTLELAGWLGVTGWYLGLVTNVVLVVVAARGGRDAATVGIATPTRLPPVWKLDVADDGRLKEPAH